MTLHPHITRAELAAYCELCHEHGIKSVRVEKEVAQAIEPLILHGTPMRFLGIKFKIKK